MHKISKGKEEYENFVKSLNDDKVREEYKSKYDNYNTSLLPNILGGTLVYFGNIFYGKNPSYIKFRAVEVIARVPYQSWSSAAYTMLTLFYTNEKKAIELSRLTHFSRHANDNETMHVVVISQIVKEEHHHMSRTLHSIVPMLFSFFYFWASYILSLINNRWSYEINYLFENHAYEQYELFIERYGERMKSKKVDSCFLDWYGRPCANQYELFTSIRNDELVHRNKSIEAIEGKE